jgi:methyl coenzyme M reductase subunit D
MVGADGFVLPLHSPKNWYICQSGMLPSLSDVYSAIGYYLRHQEAVEAYLNYREQLADSVRQRLLDLQPDLTVVRSRLLAQKQS